MRGVYSGPRGLVGVEDRGADEQDRAEDEVGEEDRAADGDVGLALEEQREQEPRQAVHDGKSGDGTERVDVVRCPEASAALQRPPKADPLDDGRRHGEPDEGEPRGAG